jgi:hypothetical protein
MFLSGFICVKVQVARSQADGRVLRRVLFQEGNGILMEGCQPEVRGGEGKETLVNK